MGVVYRVDLEDQTGTVVAQFKQFESLRITSTWLDKGNYQLVLSGFDPRVALFGYDYLIKVWMQDTDNLMPWQKVFTGIHKSKAKALNEDGSRTFSSFGPDENELLDKEFITWPAGTPQSEKSGLVSTVMREFVNENIGALALVAGGRESNGVVAGLSLAADPLVGPAWSGARSNKHLLKTLRELAAYAAEQGNEVDYRVTSQPGYTWLFECGKLGVDRTTIGLNTTTGLNAAGNVPVVFGEQFGNVSSLQLSESRMNTFTTVVALGKGDGPARAFNTAEQVADVALSPIARRSTVTNASNNDASDLAAVADAKLHSLVTTKKFSFKPYKAGQVFNRDYFLGDYITAQDEGVEYHKRIVQSTITVSADQVEDVALEFQDV